VPAGIVISRVVTAAGITSAARGASARPTVAAAESEALPLTGDESAFPGVVGSVRVQAAASVLVTTRLKIVALIAPPSGGEGAS
jgi:hypothetical protein